LFLQTKRRKRMLITSLELIAGGAAVHVTVVDENLDPLPPTDVSWTLPDGVTANPDATGFNFTAATGTAVGTLSDTATYDGPGAAGPVTGSLPINVVAGVTALQFTSP
jgi:hypothetical protein